MEGIEVLNSTELTSTPAWTMILIVVGFFLIIIFGKITDKTNHKTWSDIFMIATFVSLFIFLAGVICAVSIEKPTGKYEYQVTVDDTVSLTEFNEKYEIIKQEGKIWTIREKE